MASGFSHHVFLRIKKTLDFNFTNDVKSTLYDWRTLFYMILCVSFIASFASSVVKYGYSVQYELAENALVVEELDLQVEVLYELIRSYNYEAVETVVQTLEFHPRIVAVTLTLENMLSLAPSADFDPSQLENVYIIKLQLIEYIDFEGSLVFYMRETKNYEFAYSAIISGFYLFAVLLFINLFIATFYIVYYIMRPFENLSAAIDQTVALGEPMMAKVDEGLTLGRLARQFNRMQAALKGTRISLESEKQNVQSHSDILNQVMRSFSMGVKRFSMESDFTVSFVYGDRKVCIKNLPNEVFLSVDQYKDWAIFHLDCSTNLVDEGLEGVRSNVIYHVENRFNNAFYSVFLIKLPNGDFAYITRDITSEKNIQMELKKAQRMEVVGQLVSGISHDFNNILGVILGNLELGLDFLGNDTKEFKYVNRAITATKRASSIATTLLRSVRRGQGNQEGEYELLDVIADSVDIASETMASNITITLVNNSSGKFFVEKPGLDSAILNLIVNARDAMPKGGTIFVEINVVLGNPVAKSRDLIDSYWAELSVVDQGEGIAPGIIDNILKPYFTTKNEGEGTGLGLGMVRDFVESLGGEIEFNSAKPKGTRACLKFPVDVMRSSIESVAKDRFEHEGAMPVNDLVVVLIEDEESLLEMLGSSMSAFGANVLMFNGVEQFQDHVSKNSSHHMDIIISDLNLGDGNAMDVLNLCKTYLIDVPVVLMTGNLNFGSHVENVETLFANIIQKPFALSDFLRVVISTVADKKQSK